MAMKKGTFKIAMKCGVVEERTGWIDYELSLTFYKLKSGKDWMCSDYRTGRSISLGSSRKDAVEHILNRGFLKLRDTPEYAALPTLNP